MEQAQILVVDDTPKNLKLLSTILEEQNYKVRCVTKGKNALQVAQSGWAELILLDIKLPQMNGYEVCQQLKLNEKTKNIPVIFLSNLDDTFDKVRVFEAGGADYITKPFQLQEVLIRVKNQILTQKLQGKFLLLNKQLEAKVKVRTAELETNNKKLELEIKQLRQAQENLLKLALHDSVTGLPNRNSFLGKLKDLLLQYRQQPERKFTVFLVSSDRLTEIKCHLDHLATNQLLGAIANRLQNCLPNNAILSRFESNEFAIILQHSTEDKPEIINWVEIIQQQFQEPFTINATTFNTRREQPKFTINCSIGIVTSNNNYSVAYDILRNAETAVYQAQKNKNSNYYFFSNNNELNKDYLTRKVDNLSLSSQSTLVTKQLKAHFRETLLRKKIYLSYQPIFQLQPGENYQIKGLEVFNNQQSDYKKLLVLTKFFRDIDESKLSIYLNNVALDYALLELKELQQQHEKQQNLFLAMQFTEQELLQSNLVSTLCQIIYSIQLLANSFHLDITGDHSTVNNKQIMTLIQKLARLGIKLNLNCFNLPYQTIKKLSSLPFNNFKINGSLISQITHQNETENSLSVIAKIINLAHENKITVTAKDIETEEQLVALKSIGCDYGQGNLLSKPLDMESLEAFLVWRI